MKTTHQKQIKTFLKKEAEKIYLPFLKSFSKSGKVAQVFQKMIDVLPTIKKAKTKNEKLDKKNLSPVQLNDVKPKFNNPLVLKASQTVVKLPQVDKEKLVSMVKNKQILNRLESSSKNQYVLTVPAYEDGKNVKNELSKLINVTSPKNQARLEQKAGNAAIQDKDRDAKVKEADTLVAASKSNNEISKSEVEPPKSTTAKLEENATKAGGSSGAKITVIGDKAKEASLVGEKQGEVEAITKTAVLPEKKVEDAAEAAAAVQANAATPEEAGSGAKRGGEALADMALTALSFVPGLGVAGGVLKGLKGLGAVGKMARMAKGMGGGSPLSAMSSGGRGGMGGMLGAAGGGGGGMGGMLGAAGCGRGGMGGMLGAAGGGGGGMGGMLGAGGGGGGGMGGMLGAGGGGGGMLGAATKGGGLGGVLGSVGGALGGLAGAAAMATPVGMALAAAPAIGAAAGGIASGVGAAAGGLAAGIGSAVGGIASAYGSIGGALIGGIFGNGKEKESKPVVVQGNGAAPMSITNITYQYDIYRKTADDSFMLPNYRREYG